MASKQSWDFLKGQRPIPSLNLFDPEWVWLSQSGRGSPPKPHLHGHVSHDGALVALQRLQGDLADLALRLAQEHLAGGRQHLLVLPLDLHLRRGRGCEHLGTP